jgi:hypothetical protein
MLPIAVDVGGDKCRERSSTVTLCSRELDVPVVLVGRPDEITDAGGLEIVPASKSLPWTPIRRRACAR